MRPGFLNDFGNSFFILPLAFFAGLKMAIIVGR
jgi:hypothetical protein